MQWTWNLAHLVHDMHLPWHESLSYSVVTHEYRPKKNPSSRWPHQNLPFRSLSRTVKKRRSEKSLSSAPIRYRIDRGSSLEPRLRHRTSHLCDMVKSCLLSALLTQAFRASVHNFIYDEEPSLLPVYAVLRSTGSQSPYQRTYVPLGKLCGRPPRSAFCRKLPHLRPPASRSVASDSCPSREVQKFRSKLPLRLGSGCLSIIVGNSPQPWRVGGQKSKAEPQNVGDIPPAKNERTLPAPENGREARTSGMPYGCRTAGVGT